jgi:ABC-2 type transport system ATP-binding protein
VPAIAVENVWKSYENRQAVKGISFTVPAGQVCGYLGPNGAGKSTTIKMLAGILSPDAGVVRIGGCDMHAGVEARRQIGYVPESGALYSLLTPREHLDLISDLHEIDVPLARERQTALLRMFGIEGLADKRIDTLSKGQKQKVLISTMLIHDPKVVLLDEPFNGLDVEAARVLKQVIRELAAEGRAVLFSSHILDIVERLCDRTIILNHGEIVADAPTATLLAGASDRTLESVFHNLVRVADIEGLAEAFLDTIHPPARMKKKKQG